MTLNREALGFGLAFDCKVEGRLGGAVLSGVKPLSPIVCKAISAYCDMLRKSNFLISSSSLSISSSSAGLATSLSSISFPIRTLLASAVGGKTILLFEEEVTRGTFFSTIDDLNFDIDGLGGGWANVASRGTSYGADE